MAYWLLKSEPEEFGIDDLEQKECEMWEGVRNYQARNFMREMKQGDLAFLYHSSCKTVGIAGVMRIEKAAIPIQPLKILHIHISIRHNQKKIAGPQWM